MNTFIPCSNCKNGYIFEKDEVTKCSCLKEYQSSMKLEIGLVKSGVYDEAYPSIENYKGKDSAGNLLKINKYVQGLNSSFKKKSNLYFVGPNGSQKSYTSKAIIKEAIVCGLSCRFILMNELIEKLTDIYEKEYNESIEQYYECDLLVLDDCFDSKKVVIFKSGYQIPYLDKFLRKRIEVLGGNTIFTSNIPIEKIDISKFSLDIKNLLERSILNKGGQLIFSDVYSTIEDSDILNMWN